VIGRARGSLLAALCLVQIAVPIWMIVARERVLREGTLYRFRTAPVDPYDAFRGRFVALGFEAASVRTVLAGDLERGETLYGVIEVGPDGFARFSRIALERPDEPYVRAAVQFASTNELRLDLPFDRFYLDEHLAPEAERAIQALERERQGGRVPAAELETFAAVRVLGGRAVLEELYVGGEPVRDYLRRVAR
jgi:uncharacterized membrane-anchored protein